MSSSRRLFLQADQNSIAQELKKLTNINIGLVETTDNKSVKARRSNSEERSYRHHKPAYLSRSVSDDSAPGIASTNQPLDQ